MVGKAEKMRPPKTGNPILIFIQNLIIKGRRTKVKAKLFFKTNNSTIDFLNKYFSNKVDDHSFSCSNSRENLQKVNWLSLLPQTNL